MKPRKKPDKRKKESEWGKVETEAVMFEDNSPGSQEDMIRRRNVIRNYRLSTKNSRKIRSHIRENPQRWSSWKAKLSSWELSKVEYVREHVEEN